MKTTHCTSIVIATLAVVVAAGPSQAGVKVDTAEPIETEVAFRVAAGEYIRTSPSNGLELATGKISSRATFTIVDLTGGNLLDGDEVRVRYTPHQGKPSYWLENTAGIRRGHDGDVFKLKRVDTKFALLTPTGRFVAPPTSTIALGVSARQDGALLVDIIDPKSGASASQAPDQPSAAPSAPATLPATPSSAPALTAPPPPSPATPAPAAQ